MMEETDHNMAHVVEVANAVLAAKDHDPLSSACGLAFFASVLAEEDEATRVTVAYVMLRLALELDPDLCLALRLN
jgi:hypothetical protein